MSNRGKNKTYYHYKIKNLEDGSEKYHFTLDEIKNEFNVSRATLHNWLSNPARKPKKMKNYELERSYKHRLNVDFNIPEEVIL